MNAYRVALILCRAVAIALWWGAGIQLLSGIVVVLITRVGWISGNGLPPITSTFWLPLGYFVLKASIASFLLAFAPWFSAVATGGASLEGESMLSRRKPEPQDMALAQTGAGLIILFYSFGGFLPTVIWGIYEFFYSPIMNGMAGAITRSASIYHLVGTLIPTVLQCLVGFILAFRLGLRRMINFAD